MNVLMFGWEFPPHISGGLGTACYGLTKGLSTFSNVNMTFVVPRAGSFEITRRLTLLGASDVPVFQTGEMYNGHHKKMKYMELPFSLVPYSNPDEFWKLAHGKYAAKTRFVKTDKKGRMFFSGEYGQKLFDEVFNYAAVAAAIAQQDNFDIIHVHDWMTFSAGIEAKKVSGKPLVLHVHSTEFDRGAGVANPQIYALERHGMESADAIVAVSNYTKQILIEKYGIPESKISVIYNAVEPFKLSSKISINKGVKEKLVTFLGRITVQKGPAFFVEAACAVLKRNRNVRFVMAGTGDLLRPMIRKVNRLGIADKFHFTGYLENYEVYSLFKMSDVYVLPSVSEPFGISVLEAIQCRVPVVVSKQSGVSEVISNAVKVDYWDIEAMSCAICDLLENESLSNDIKKKAYAEVKNMRWNLAAAQLHELYLELINA